jgi:predicted unusual protein kinase regulating ubiquinone biosynthesis (AarF/ABC1/UbiB family)
MEKQRAQSQSGFNNKKKSRFCPLEDSQLKNIVEKYGTKDWNFISSLINNRNPRQCKDRWEKFLSPQVDQSPWTKEEDHLLIQKRNELGPHWIKISLFFPTRTDVSV